MLVSVWRVNAYQPISCDLTKNFPLVAAEFAFKISLDFLRNLFPTFSARFLRNSSFRHYMTTNYCFELSEFCRIFRANVGESWGEPKIQMKSVFGVVLSQISLYISTYVHMYVHYDQCRGKLKLSLSLRVSSSVLMELHVEQKYQML